MIAGCYTIDLYCDVQNCKHKPLVNSCYASFAERDARDCYSVAKQKGWKFNRSKTKCVCPGCAKEGRKVK